MNRFEEWRITTKAGLLAAIVAAVVAAGIARGDGTVRVHETSANLPLAEETTTSTLPLETTTTTLARTTTTAAPAGQRIIVIEKRVTEVEDRVTRLEETTTTTTTAPPVPEVTLADNAIGMADGAGTWTQDFGRVLEFVSTMPMPGLKVTFKHYVTGEAGVEIRDFTAAFEEGQTKVTYFLPPELVSATGHLEDIYQGIVSVAWDGKQ